MKTRKQFSLYMLTAALLVMLVAACGPAKQPTVVPAAKPVAAVAEPATASSTDVVASGEKLNINTATPAELLAVIPGLGDKMVAEFADYRPYSSIVQFRQEMGKYVDEATIAEYEKYVYVPVDINASDEATIQETLKVDAVVAADLVAARPYTSGQAFLDQLAASVPAVDLATAALYLVAN